MEVFSFPTLSFSGFCDTTAEGAKVINSRHLEERITDLRIYRAQLRRILENCLYFLAIQADGKTLHKIGLTKRSIQERIIEVRRDLAAYYKFVEIQVIDTWNHRGNVELYFKHRYKDFNYKIGTLTEYFQFDDVAAVREDLPQMKPKDLAAVELEILEKINRVAWT